ncbi:MAG TPA: UDP-N-acetylmuramate--L-alanine ligase [Acidimicrobiia bacterium]
MSLPPGRIHLVGAGGTGMSALAKVLVAMGHTVSGSDLRSGPALAALADLDVEVFTGHNPGAVHGASLVVASSAVPDYDEELEAARARGITVWRRPELLAALTADIPTIGATGTHGKTTTTALMVTALRGTGEDPSFVVGGDLVDLGTNGHYGETPLLVLEADEAFRTFESLELQGLVVTNVEHEHVDHFASAAGMVDSFISVAGRVDGPVVACLDDPGSARVAGAVGATTYGFADNADWRITEMTTGRDGIRFRLLGPDASTTVEMVHPGRHLARNAAGALTLLAVLGHDLQGCATAMSGFRGVGRRWEHKGTIDGVILYDDYAHHPTEVAAMIDAAGVVAPGRIWAVFQPHLYTRTERFSEDFGKALARADVAVVTDVFGAREEPVPGITGELVAEATRLAGGDVHYVPHRSDLAEFIAPKVKPGDLVLSMGAGDITLLHSELAPILVSKS